MNPCRLPPKPHLALILVGSGEPERYGGHWEVFGEALRHGPGDAADLHLAISTTVVGLIAEFTILFSSLPLNIEWYNV